MNEGKRHDDSSLRRLVMEKLYEAYRAEGLYRGVVPKKELGKQLSITGAELERNLEYLLDRELIRMHKIEDLISMTTNGIDAVERGEYDRPDGRVEQSLDADRKAAHEYSEQTG